MSVKLVRISSKIHRTLAIEAATQGVTISALTERAILRELQMVTRKKDKAARPQTKKQVEPTGVIQV